MSNLFQKTLSLAKAILTGKDVGEDRLAKRLAICSTCDRVRNNDGILSCGICGCRLKGDKSLVNLARYEETSTYGCKHREGSKWRKAGV